MSGDARETWEEVPTGEARVDGAGISGDPKGDPETAAETGRPDRAADGASGVGTDSAAGEDTGSDPAGGEGTGPGEASSGEEVGDLAGEVDLLGRALRERDDYLDALRHLQADFENYRKRVAKQQVDLSARATESLVEKLLPALDVADLAVAHGASGEVEQVCNTLLDALEREGLERIQPPAGRSFDPTLHDAVAHEEGDGAGQEIAEVLRAGYSWKGRVLRPAMVKVRG